MVRFVASVLKHLAIRLWMCAVVDEMLPQSSLWHNLSLLSGHHIVGAGWPGFRTLRWSLRNNDMISELYVWINYRINRVIWFGIHPVVWWSTYNYHFVYIQSAEHFFYSYDLTQNTWRSRCDKTISYNEFTCTASHCFEHILAGQTNRATILWDPHLRPPGQWHSYMLKCLTSVCQIMCIFAMGFIIGRCTLVEL